MSLPQLKYLSVLPSITGSCCEEFESCLEQVSVKQGIEFTLIKITIFLGSASEEAFAGDKQQIRSIIHNKYPDQCPVFSILSQPPAEPYKTGIEAVLLPLYENTSFRNFEDIPYVVLENAEYKIIWAGGLTDSIHLMSVRDGANKAFIQMYNLLMHENLNFNHLIRQWNYIPQICEVIKFNGLNIQNYQSFNDVRHNYNHKYRTKKCFPAATGIGQNYGNFTLDFIAFEGKNNILDLKVESPLQFNPYHYGQNVLVGESLENAGKKYAPEFERARILVSARHAVIYISGTASIEGEKTTGINDITQQTYATILTIQSLVSNHNLNQQYPDLDIKDAGYTCIRAYVKFKSDILLVEEILRKEFRNIPFIVIQAEICRCDLLVEIEAEMQVVLQ